MARWEEKKESEIEVMGGGVSMGRC